MGWTYATLRLADAAAWAAARPLLPLGSDVIEAGTAYVPLPPDAPEGTVPEALSGWWVSVAVRGPLPEALRPMRAAAPPGVPVLGEATPHVQSVGPVAFRWVARRLPNPQGSGTVLDALMAAAAADPDLATELEYATVFRRDRLIASGVPAAVVDAVLAKAAEREAALALL